MDDCAQLARDRQFAQTQKVFWEGVITHGVDFRIWKMRYAKMYNGKLYTYEYEVPLHAFPTKNTKDIIYIC